MTIVLLPPHDAARSLRFIIIGIIFWKQKISIFQEIDACRYPSCVDHSKGILVADVTSCVGLERAINSLLCQ